MALINFYIHAETIKELTLLVQNFNSTANVLSQLVIETQIADNSFLSLLLLIGKSIVIRSVGFSTA